MGELVYTPQDLDNRRGDYEGKSDAFVQRIEKMAGKLRKGSGSRLNVLFESDVIPLSITVEFPADLGQLSVEETCKRIAGKLLVRLA
jgi:hypothetical protein